MTTLEQAGQRALHTVEKLGLALIAIATVVAIGQEVMVMIGNLTVRLADLLLLFIYLEVLAMAGIYLKSGEMPVRLPLYIAIVALARYLVLDMKSLDVWRMLGVTASILLLTCAVLVIRYGHLRFPYKETPSSRDSPP